MRQSFELLEGQKLIAYYDEPWILDYFRHLAFDHNIGLVAVPMPEEDLPANDKIDQFIKRFLSYAVTQSTATNNHDPLEKACELYWKKYMKLGEAGFRTWLLAKLSKIDLVGKIVPRVTEFQTEHYTWVDADFAFWLENNQDLRALFDGGDYAPLAHFPSPFNYLGKPLAVGAHCLGANLSTWREISAIYHEQIERLGHFPYGYDEEVLLSLARAQHPEQFAHFDRLLQAEEAGRYLRFKS